MARRADYTISARTPSGAAKTYTNTQTGVSLSRRQFEQQVRHVIPGKTEYQGGFRQRFLDNYKFKHRKEKRSERAWRREANEALQTIYGKRHDIDRAAVLRNSGYKRAIRDFSRVEEPEFEDFFDTEEDIDKYREEQ